MIETTWMTPALLAWIPAGVYFLAGWPQIFTTWKTKSADGLSSRMIFLGALGSVARLLYNELLGLPIGYRVMRPLTLVVFIIMMMQSYYYTKDKLLRRNMLLTYSSLVLLSAGLVAYSIFDAILVGHITGWVSAAGFALYQLPQISKNYQRQSVDGVNFAYLTLIVIGNLLEMLVALMLGLPMQSVINGFRGMIYYSIFCYQFILYSGQDECDGGTC